MCGKTYYMIQGGLLIQATKQHNPVSLSLSLSLSPHSAGSLCA